MHNISHNTQQLVEFFCSRDDTDSLPKQIPLNSSKLKIRDSRDSIIREHNPDPKGLIFIMMENKSM